MGKTTDECIPQCAAVQFPWFLNIQGLLTQKFPASANEDLPYVTWGALDEFVHPFVSRFASSRCIVLRNLPSDKLCSRQSVAFRGSMSSVAMGLSPSPVSRWPLKFIAIRMTAVVAWLDVVEVQVSVTGMLKIPALQEGRTPGSVRW